MSVKVCERIAKASQNHTYNQWQVVKQIAHHQHRMNRFQSSPCFLFIPQSAIMIGWFQTGPSAIRRANRCTKITLFTIIRRTRRHPVCVVIAQFTQIGRGFLYIIETRHFRLIQMVTDHQETRHRYNRQENVKDDYENVEFHVELKGHKAARWVPQEMVMVVCVLLRQNCRNANTRTQRGQTK